VNEHFSRQAYVRPHTSVTELLSCVRQNYYARSKYDINIDKNFNFPYLKLYADVGTAIHEHLQSVYPFTEIKKAIYSDKFRVKGEADAINKNYLCEIKSIEVKKIKFLPEIDHFHQGNIYAHVLNTEYNYNINGVTIIYVFRDDLKRDPLAIDFKIDTNLAIDFLSRSLILLDAIERKVIPEKIGNTEDKCKWCPYSDYCIKDGDGIKIEAVIKKEEPKKQKEHKKEKKIPQEISTFKI